MKRRSFLSLLSAAIATPALPGGVAAKAASYNRFTYGYAVFWARHGGAFGVQQLAKAMRIPEAQAKAMIDEMLQDRLVRASNAGVRAMSNHGGRSGTTTTHTTERKPRLFWKFRRVGLRARALQQQLLQSHPSSAPLRATV